MYVRSCTGTYLYLHVYLCTYIDSYVYRSSYTHLNTCNKLVNMYICKYNYTYIHIYIYIRTPCVHAYPGTFDPPVALWLKRMPAKLHLAALAQAPEELIGFALQVVLAFHRLLASTIEVVLLGNLNSQPTLHLTSWKRVPFANFLKFAMRSPRKRMPLCPLPCKNHLGKKEIQHTDTCRTIAPKTGHVSATQTCHGPSSGMYLQAPKPEKTQMISKGL